MPIVPFNVVSRAQVELSPPPALKASTDPTCEQNGVGAFILQCKRLDFHYCDWWASSKGMNLFIKKKLPDFAKQNPDIEINISPVPRTHPSIVAHYVNGRTDSICARKLDPTQIMVKALALRNSDGKKEKRVRKPVESYNDNVRGIWSGLHSGKISIGWDGKVKK
jgi:large subunit ribosomal protein L43